MAKPVEMDIIEDVTSYFEKYLKERVTDRCLVQLVNVFHYGKPQQAVFVHVERDMVPDKVLTYAQLYTPAAWAKAETAAKFCTEAREYFNEMEYKNRSHSKLH